MHPANVSTHLLQALDKSVINVGSESDGLKNATNGTSASLTSTNNFINFCKGKTITNGQQIKGGSCNPIPMGDIPNTDNIPTCKYVFPQNFDTLKANQAFTMKLAVANVQLGVFTNADTNYYAAPQQLNAKGQIIGHTHLVIEKIDSLKSTTPTKPLAFAFFKGVDTPAGADGTVSVPVPSGLPEGTYRCGTIGTQANHIAWSVPVAQHGILEDVVYVSRSLFLEYENQLLTTTAILFFFSVLAKSSLLLFLKFFRSP